MEIPQVVNSITLDGRQAKVFVTDYTFGTSRIHYSTAQIFFAGQIGGRDVIYFYGDMSQEHEVSIYLRGDPRRMIQSGKVSFIKSGAYRSIISFLAGIEGFLTIWDSSQQLVLFSDTETAGTFWSPLISINSSNTFSNYWQFGSNSSILVGGPYLVRDASISGTNLALRGDLKTDVRLFVIASDNIQSITWNNLSVALDMTASTELTSQGGFVGQLRGPERYSGFVLPTLKNWKYADSLPEIDDKFCDEGWVIANHTHTNIPFKPHYTDGRILYGCDYGLYVHHLLWTFFIHVHSYLAVKTLSYGVVNFMELTGLMLSICPSMGAQVNKDIILLPSELM
jgi:hypothetical protein